MKLEQEFWEGLQEATNLLGVAEERLFTEISLRKPTELTLALSTRVFLLYFYRTYLRTGRFEPKDNLRCILDGIWPGHAEALSAEHFR